MTHYRFYPPERGYSASNPFDFNEINNYDKLGGCMFIAIDYSCSPFILNYPSDGIGIYFLLAVNAYIKQFFMPYSNANAIYVRSYYSSSGWSDWRKIETKALN